MEADVMIGGVNLDEADMLILPGGMPGTKYLGEIKDEGDVIFDKSCFYAESGGQCADTGYIYNDSIKAFVNDVKKAPNGQFLHNIKLEKGSIKIGDVLKQEINTKKNSCQRYCGQSKNFC